MTPQDALNIAVNGIRTQNALAKRVAPTAAQAGCAYYDNTNGNRCAIGHLLDIEEAKRWEPFGATVVRDAYARGLFVDRELDLDFLVELQVAHDDASTVKYFLNNARHLAIRHNLEFPET